MLNKDVADVLSTQVINRMNKTNEYILEQIGESIKKLGALTPSKAYELAQIMKYGGDYNKIVKELSKATKLSVQDINNIFEQTAENDYRFAEEFYKYRNKPYLPFKDNVVLRNAVEAIKRTALEDFVNLASTTALGYGILDEDGNIQFMGIKDVYNKIIDEAVESISQGKETFGQVMRRRMEELGQSGLKVIYPTTYIGKNRDGQPVVKHYSRRLDSAIRMNIQDGLNQMYNNEQAILGEQFESDGIELTAHSYPAPDHALMQGRQFTNEEYIKLNNQEQAETVDHIIIPADDHRRRVSTLNCKHNERRIIVGVSKPRYSKEQLQRVMEDNEEGLVFEQHKYTLYQATQVQRQLELALRKLEDTKILANSSGDTELYEKTVRKISGIRKKHKELTNLIKISTSKLI